MDRWTSVLALASIVTLLGCPADDEPTGDTEDSAGTETSSTTDATSTSASTSAGTDSGTSAATTTESTTDATSTTAGPGTDGSSSGGTGASTEGSTGGQPDACAELGRDECVADETCEPIVCQPFEAQGQSFCIGAEAFIGCRSVDLECAEIRTTTCEGPDATVYVCGNACIPDGWDECPAPVDGGVGMCPGNG